MINNIYLNDWFGRETSDYTFNPSDLGKSIVKIPNHKYSTFLYNEDKAERICSSKIMLYKEMMDMINSMGLHGIKIKFSDSNPTACTDGKFIEIGIGDKFNSIFDCYEKLDRIIGMTIHESCHCLYTDFLYAKRMIGKYNSHVHYIHNIIEDEMIERKLCSKFPGYERFLNKLKYNIFEKEAENEGLSKSDINNVFTILFYLIRYPKFIGTLDENILNKYSDIFDYIKAIMESYDCFNVNNEHITESSVNSAIEIYDILKDLINELNDDSDELENNKDGESNKSGNGESINDESGDSTNNESGDSDECKNIEVNVITEEESKESDQTDEEKIFNVIKNILNNISSESEMPSINDMIVYHSNIESSKSEMGDYEFNELQKAFIKNDQIITWTNGNPSSYLSYKKDIDKFIDEANKLIILNKKKPVYQDIKFNRNGSLDPTRLANAMCNEQNVYIRKDCKYKDGNPEYALVIMIDESGSMEYDNINELASKLAILLYEATVKYPKVKIFVYGHGDTVYNYVNITNNKSKYTLGDRRTQGNQNEILSYEKIINDVKSQTKLPIVCFNITDSCYFADERKLAHFVYDNANNKKQPAYINLICLGQNNSVNESCKKWNDIIYGEGNWVLYEDHTITNNLYNVIKQIASIIHRTVKL